MAHLQTNFVAHTRRVCSLYKRALRNIESWIPRRDNMRIQQVLMRDRFEKNRHIKDLIEAQKLLNDGEEELFQKMHPQPKYFANSPGGVAYERVVTPPDWVLDFWHPMEKAAYPDYFAKREQRKKEFIKLYEKIYAKK